MIFLYIDVYSLYIYIYMFIYRGSISILNSIKFGSSFASPPPLLLNYFEEELQLTKHTIEFL